MRGTKFSGTAWHRFITIELSHAWLVRVLARHEKLVAGLLRETLFASPPRGGVGAARPMSVLHEETPPRSAIRRWVSPAGRFGSRRRCSNCSPI